MKFGVFDQNDWSGLRFLTDPRVPFTNILAERDGRMMKLRQKISDSWCQCEPQQAGGPGLESIPPRTASERRNSEAAKR